MNWQPMPQQQHQAYDPSRMNMVESGKTGKYVMMHYNAMGTNAQGGDTQNAVIGDGYFTGSEVKAAVDAAERVLPNSTSKITDGGLAYRADCRDGVVIDRLYNDSGTLKSRGGKFRLIGA